MRVFITGIRSFVGSELATVLRAAGHVVGGSSREGAPAEGIVALPLGTAPATDCFTNCDALIHCAWDITAPAPATNISGTRILAASATAAGVPRQIFLSSLSAHAAAVAPYGCGKFAAEAAFLALPAGAVVRPGLVVGPGGLFRSLCRQLRAHRVLPLFSGGRFPVPLVASRDLARAIQILLEAPPRPPRVYPLFHPEVPTQREFIGRLCRQLGLRRWLVPVPSGPAAAALAALERLGWRPPISAASVRAATTNPVDPTQNELPALVGSLPSLDALLSLARDIR